VIIGLGIVEGAVTAGEAFEKGISKEFIEVVDETHNAELNNIPKANSSITFASLFIAPQINIRSLNENFTKEAYRLN